MKILSGSNKINIILAGAVVVISSFFLLHNLGNSTLTLWDEAVHANVIKNLANNCCLPTLHHRDLGTDFREWDTNFIWLHKPLLPFYINTLFYKILGQSLFALRFPSYIFAELTALLIFLIGLKYFNKTTAFIAALLFAINPYAIDLVQGRQFSGFSDILFVFFSTAILFLILKIPSDNSRKNLIKIGLLTGLAFACKGGLSLIPLLTLAVTLLLNGGFKNLLKGAYAVLSALIIIAPQKIFFAMYFPVQSAYEDSQQFAHLTQSVEYWGRPFDYYFSHYIKILITPLLTLVGYFSVAYSLKTKNRNAIILATWIMSFVVPLSFAVSKISNFIFAALPALLLLVAFLITDLWQKNKYPLLAALAFTVIFTEIFIKFDIFHVSLYLFSEKNLEQRFNLLLIEGLIFIVSYELLRLFKKFINKKLAVVLGLAATFIYFGSTLKNDWLAANAYTNDPVQLEIQQTSTELKKQLPADSVLIIKTDRILRPHLFFQYWSGFDSLETYQYHPVYQLLEMLAGRAQNIYLISDQPQPRYGSAQQLPFGYLYRLR